MNKNKDNKKIKILVLMGGPSSEHEVSLSSGGEVMKYLDKNKYDVSEMILPKEFAVFDLGENIKNYDLIFNALHGEFGEDGRLQAILDSIGVKYTGSGVLASAWGMNKDRTNLIAEKHNIQIPKSVLLKNRLNIKRIVDTILLSIQIPCVIKPNKAGSSIGIEIVKDDKNLEDALERTFVMNDEILVQEYITGRELTCAVLTNAIPEKTKIFPVIEIIPKTKFYDYDAKYKADTTQYICPAKIEKKQVEKIQTESQLIHGLLGCNGLTRSDFILSEGGEIYFLEINTSPGMTSHSLCPKAAASVDISYTEFLDMIIEAAL